MSFLNKIFKSTSKPIETYSDFWSWFQIHEKEFFMIVKKGNAIDKNFFGKISPKLDQLKDGFFFLTGMYNDNTAELVLTADGIVKNIVFVEELVNSAPQMSYWKFTALKPALDIGGVSIKMGDLIFDQTNLSFYSNELPEYPDEIDITIIHDDLQPRIESASVTGYTFFLITI